MPKKKGGASVARQARLQPDALYHNCDPETLGFETTADVPPIEGTVGQERAQRSLDFGLRIRADAYNLFVAGPPGTGRSSTLRVLLKRIAKGQPVAPDWCYLFNFEVPQKPSVISLPAGRGKAFAEHMDDFIASCRRDIPRHFETEAFVAQRDELMRDVQRQRAQAFEQIEIEAKKRGFGVSAGPMGIATVPLKPDGQPMSEQEFEQLAEGDRRVTQARGEELQSMISQAMLRGRRLERGAQSRLEKLDQDATLFTITPALNDVRQEYMDIPKVVDYLEQVEKDILSHVQLFRGDPGTEQPAFPGPSIEEFFTRYKVNVFVSHNASDGAPVVFENNPTYYTLFGRVDYRPQFGAVTTDHTMIKGGSIHQANGGYLVAQAIDVLTSPLVWDTLKRILRCREIAVQNLGEQFSAIPVATLDPEPLPLDVKVVLIGSPRVHQILQQADEDFRKLFRVKADFTIEMERTPDCIGLYAGYVCSRVQQEKLRQFHKSAVARIVEHGSRLVGHQQKLSTQFMEIGDVLTEADYWASREESELVHQRHVDQAIEQKIYRSSLVEERVQDAIDEGTIMIDVVSERVGQINGISVYDLGDYRFGRPTRITARVSLGRGPVSNIEREANLSGRVHNKAFMILNGYLQATFAQQRSLSFAATLAFEQVYDEVEGDSASAAELYILLSALAEVPISQGIAVTGSINQLGEVQAIGGVNEKVEGFFAVCNAKGLTGDQGVIIPRENAQHLMLRKDVVQAVRDGKFNVWAVASVSQGIEILTGIPAGEPDERGRYPAGTVYRKCTDRLTRLSKLLAAQGRRQRRGSNNAAPEVAQNQ